MQHVHLPTVEAHFALASTFSDIDSSFPLHSLQLTSTPGYAVQVRIRSGEEHRAHFRSVLGERDELDRINEIGGRLIVALEVIDVQATPGNPNGEGEEAELLLTLERSQTRNFFAALDTEPDGYREWIQAEKAKQTPNKISFRVPLEIENKLEDAQVGQLIRIVFWDDEVGERGLIDDLLKKPYSFCHITWDHQAGKYISVPFPAWKETEKFAEKWRSLKLEEGPTLLLLHGLGGKTKRSFRYLLQDDQGIMKELVDYYQGRIIGFDHPSFYDDIEANGEKFLEMLQHDKFPYHHVKLEWDILARSRGGLVARQLIERNGLENHPINFQKVVFLASPLQGSLSAKYPIKSGVVALRLKQLRKGIAAETEEEWEEEIRESDHLAKANAKDLLYMSDMTSREANILFPGVHAQRPDSDYLVELNKKFRPTPGVEYYAIATQFHPEEADLPKRKRKKLAKLINSINKAVQNDGINPTEGALGAEKEGKLAKLSTEFSLKAQFLDEPDPNIHHESLLFSPKIKVHILKFLVGTLVQPPASNADEVVV